MLRLGTRSGSALALAIATTGVAVTFAPAPAEAHFVMQVPTNWMMTNTSDGTPEKAAPCGNETATLSDGRTPSTASGVVNTFTTNADGTTTVSITINEVVPHAGWYRVSLVPGRSSTQMTTTLPDPPTPANSCAATIATTPALPVVGDNLLPHQQRFTAPQTMSVTIPAGVTCTMASPCTLQVVEVMNDGAHFPPGCFYHHCADIAISGGGVSDAGATPSPDASSAGGSSGAGGSPGTGGVSVGTGGASTDGTAGVTGPGAAGAPPSSNDNGGGCSMAPDATSPIGVGVGALFALAGIVSRRIRRRASSK